MFSGVHLSHHVFLDFFLEYNPKKRERVGERHLMVDFEGRVVFWKRETIVS